MSINLDKSEVIVFHTAHESRTRFLRGRGKVGIHMILHIPRNSINFPSVLLREVFLVLNFRMDLLFFVAMGLGSAQTQTDPLSHDLMIYWLEYD